MTRRLFAVVASLALLTCLAARADAEGYYPAAQGYNAYGQDIEGVVTSFHRYDMTLRVRNREFPVALHPGTIIDPRGTTLWPDMRVSVQGHWDGGAFRADRIIVLDGNRGRGDNDRDDRGYRGDR